MSDMHVIRGGKATAVVYGGYPDTEELKQVYALLDLPAFAGTRVRIMPDHHAGKGCVIGFTCPIDMADPKIVPALVGVDIGCGVVAVRLTGVSKGTIDFKAFDAHLRESVPAGFRNREHVSKALARLYTKHVDSRVPWEDFEAAVNTVDKAAKGDQVKVWHSVGSLGGGNHFIEIDRDEATRDLWLVVHSGSRNFGLRVCERHQTIAKDNMGPRGGLAWLSEDDALSYLREMRLAQQVAQLNRLTMLSELLVFFDLDLGSCETVSSVHNFIGNDNVIRKGAISALAGERLVLPWNMRDGLILGIGKGNAEWNTSAPHGAGRLMARGKAKRELSIDDFRETMKDAGVWSSCIGRDTLDESPMAYKPSEEILEAIQDTVAVTAQLKPVYNFKASEER